MQGLAKAPVIHREFPLPAKGMDDVSLPLWACIVPVSVLHSQTRNTSQIAAKSFWPIQGYTNKHSWPRGSSTSKFRLSTDIPNKLSQNHSAKQCEVVRAQLSSEAAAQGLAQPTPVPSTPGQGRKAAQSKHASIGTKVPVLLLGKHSLRKSLPA